MNYFYNVIKNFKDQHHADETVSIVKQFDHLRCSRPHFSFLVISGCLASCMGSKDTGCYDGLLIFASNLPAMGERAS